MQFDGRGLFEAFADEYVALEVLEDVDVGSEVGGFERLDAEFEPESADDDEDEDEPPQGVVAEAVEEAGFDVVLAVVFVKRGCEVLLAFRGLLARDGMGGGALRDLPRMIIQRNHPPTEATQATTAVIDLL